MATFLNIAHCVESYAPAKGGMPEVVRQLSERMVAAGHTVTVLTSAHPDRSTELLNGVHVRSFSLRGNRVEGLHGDVQPYLAALREGGFDVVVFFAAQQWAFDSVADALTTIPAKKIMVPTGYSQFYNPAYVDYFEQMKTWLHHLDAHVFLSDNYTDINFARAANAKGIHLIPNGAAEEEFEAPLHIDIRKRFSISPETLLLLHVGSFTGIKGHREAVNLFLRSSVRDAVLLLAGDKNRFFKRVFERHYRFWYLNFLRLVKRRRIMITELNREDTVAAFRQADLFLFPSNVECSPIVLFESMAAGTPFLASDAGNTQEIIAWSGGGWLLPCTRRPNRWVDVDLAKGVPLLEQVCANRAQLRETGKTGQAAWKAKYTWAHIAQQYLDLYEQLVAPRA